MKSLPSEIIRRKRDGLELSSEEVKSFFSAYIDGSVPDYQAAALLMAIYLQGFSARETFDLTELMIQSGAQWQRSSPRPRADKHSTGGVGDKTSLVIGPVVAACGVDVPMISGRGLGHTGGTLDKFESIPGFQTRLARAQAEKLLAEHGVCFIGQSEEICPADRKLYSLRDVTGTVESIPLITASIMSKKISETLDALVLDVKFGSGAFMKSIDRARELALKLVEVGERADIRVAALLTNMDQPLGAFAGNSLEVKECLRILNPGTPSLSKYEIETRELSLELAAWMIHSGLNTKTLEDARNLAESKLRSGKAFEIFQNICAAQGGKLAEIPSSNILGEVLAPTDGFIKAMNTEGIGYAAVTLKAGRRIMSDVIDPTAGIQFHRKVGDSVHKGDVLFTCFGQDASTFAAAQERLLASISIGDKAPAPSSLILETHLSKVPS